MWKGFYKGGRREGPGTEYWDSGIVKFEGLWEGGCKVEGTERYENGLVFFFGVTKLGDVPR